MKTSVHDSCRRGDIEAVRAVIADDPTDHVYEAYKTSGVQVVEDIETRSWRMREFVIQDINGDRIRIEHVDESIADYSQFERHWDG